MQTHIRLGFIHFGVLPFILCFFMSAVYANVAPTISGVPPLKVSVGKQFSFSPTATDADGDALTFAITKMPSWLTFDASTGKLSGIPSAANVGTTTAGYVISVSDGKGGTAKLPAYNISVKSIAVTTNERPVISGVPPLKVNVGQLFSFTPTASDANDDPLTFSITGKPTWAAFDTATGKLSGTPSVANVGLSPQSYVISVSDGKGGTASLAAFNIVVTNTGVPAVVNRPPLINGIPAPSAEATKVYTFTPAGSDPDNDALAYSISAKPAWATFDTATGKLTGTPVSGDIGTTTSNIIINVSDGKGGTASLPAFNINVIGNRPPTISGIPAASAETNKVYTFMPVGSDPDGDALNYNISAKPAWATFDTKSGKLSGTPATADFGTTTNSVIISVSDGKGGTAALTPFNINVIGNRPPIISGNPSTQIEATKPYIFAPVGSDPDGDTLTYSISAKPAWATFDTATGKLTGTPASTDIGTAASNIVISVTDGKSSPVSLPAFSISVFGQVNVAKQFGIASQGATYPGASAASNAIDGDNNTINHTTCDATNNWWQVKLPKQTLISKIVVRNRTTNTTRLNGAGVYVTDDPYTTVPSDAFKVATLTSDITDQVTTFTAPKTGAYVIIKALTDCLNMREVEVYGTVPDAPEFDQASYSFSTPATVQIGDQAGTINVKDWQNNPITISIVGTVPFAIDNTGKLTVKGPVQPGTTYSFTVKATDGANPVTAPVTIFVDYVNVARQFGIASQGSTFNNDANLTANKVIDGLNTTNNHTDCEATTNWWQVKVPKSTQISRIAIRNITSFPLRLNGATVYVTDSPYTDVPADSFKVATLTGVTTDQVTTFATPKVGAYVIVKASAANCLHMREVEVFGTVPGQPEFAQPSYSFRTRSAVPVGEQIGAVNAKDWQNDAIAFSVVGDVPFAVDNTGKLTVNGAVQAGLTYNFSIKATDGTNPSMVPVTVEVTSSDAFNNAIRTGIVTGVTQQELKLNATAIVDATKNAQQTALNSIFKLNQDGTTMIDSITGLSWDPTHDSAYYDSLNSVENFPIIISNATANTGGISAHKNLAMAGIKDNGARYAVMANNPLHDLKRTTEPGGTANAKMNDFMKSLITWLVGRDVSTGPFKVVTAHLPDSFYFKHDATTRLWVTSNYPSAAVNASDTCESTLLSNCLLGADLLIIGSDNGSEDNHGVAFDLNSTMAAVKNAQANGIPVLFVNYDGFYDSGRGVLFTALMGYFNLDASDNYFSREKVVDYTTNGAVDTAAIDSILTALLTTQSESLNYVFDAPACGTFGSTVEKCKPELLIDPVTNLTLQLQFFDGVNRLRKSLQSLDQAGINLFSLDDTNKLTKIAVLLGDSYRQSIRYPMDRNATPNSAFLQGLFADYVVHYARPSNTFQPDMGRFTDAQAELNAQATVTRTLNFTPTVFDEWTSAGLYVPPGKAITVRRIDSSAAVVKLKFNFVRLSTRIWSTNDYNRPNYLGSNEMQLDAGKSYTFSSPYGGPIYVHWDAVIDGAVPFTLEFGNVLSNPLLTQFDDASITNFSEAVNAANSDWVDIKTPYAEIHTLKSHLQSAFDNQNSSNNGYTNADVQNYIDDLNNYLILGNYRYGGIVGAGITAMPPEVEAFCVGTGLTAVNYDGTIRNLCTDTVINAKPKIQHINADVSPLCGALCAGNPFDSGSPIDPLGWGENHEMGHNLQAARLKIYDSRSSEVSNNIFPLHTQWAWTVTKGLTKHPTTTDRPNYKAAFNILQAAIKANTPANNTSHPLWSGTGTYDNAFSRLAFYMQLAFTQQSWDMYTKLYKLDHIFADATKTTAKWDTIKGLVGFNTYTSTEAKAITGNDFMYVAVSNIARKDYRDFFAAWGILVSQKAKNQVAANGITVLMPKVFYYLDDGIPAVMPTDADTIPLDGVSAWADPTP